MDYVALDVETANHDQGSICQIGLAAFHNGEIVDKWSTLVNPRDSFSDFHVQIHGITESDVKGAPDFSGVYPDLNRWISKRITIHHMPFDKLAITKACLRSNLVLPETTWLDSAKIARRTWDQCAQRFYGLADVTTMLGIEFQHHDALEDAIAAGTVVQKACEETGLTINDWILNVDRKIRKVKKHRVKAVPNPDGYFYGKNIVFTGTLLSLSRSLAKTIAYSHGFDVKSGVSKKVDYMVVGIQDPELTTHPEKSSKQLKAEILISKGHQIEILTENQFIELLKNTV